MADEKRRQRTSSFTRSLQRIAERIDRTFEFEVQWQNDFTGPKEKRKFCVKNLGVFGSWAKGALFCADLDLIANVEVTEGFLPMTSTIRKVLTNGARYVRLYVGKPEKNDFGVAVEEAVLIWWFEVNDPVQTWKIDHSSRAASIINGNYVHVGCPSIDLRRLDHHSCSGLQALNLINNSRYSLVALNTRPSPVGGIQPIRTMPGG